MKFILVPNLLSEVLVLENCGVIAGILFGWHPVLEINLIKQQFHTSLTNNFILF